LCDEGCVAITNSFKLEVFLHLSEINGVRILRFGNFRYIIRLEKPALDRPEFNTRMYLL